MCFRFPTTTPPVVAIFLQQEAFCPLPIFYVVVHTGKLFESDIMDSDVHLDTF